MVPPYLDDKIALAAPKNVTSLLGNRPVWLLTGNDDEYASETENLSLFESIPGSNKRHLTFDSGHILPKHYVKRIKPWFL